MRYLCGLSLVTIIALVGLAGCKPKEPEVVVPPPPPPKTVTEIYSDYKAALQPLLAGTNITYGTTEPIISQFKTTRAQYTQEINEPEAVAKIENDVNNAIKQVRDAEQWYALDGLLNVHKYLNPNSQRYDSLRTRTDLMLARPWVKVTGFAEIDPGDLITFMDITDPKTLETNNFKVREGEEFYPDAEGNMVLRLVRVIGNQSAVELEYLKLEGETWEVPGPKNN